MPVDPYDAVHTLAVCARFAYLGITEEVPERFKA